MTPHIPHKKSLVQQLDYKKIVIVSSPSGGGKNTLINIVLEKNPCVEHSTSTTSRKPRAGEIDGKSYYFVTPEKFEAMIQNNEFLEWARVLDNYYGTSLAEIRRILDKQNVAILDIDIQGAEQIKKKFPGVTTIFIEPPSLEILEERLRKRGTETEAQIIKRLELARHELIFKNDYDHVILNDKIDRAANELMAIINSI